MSSNNQDKIAGRKKALKEFLIGVAVAIVGGIATAVSYNSAKPGGSYTVYTGLIALGIVYAAIGLWRLAFPLGLRGNKKSGSNHASASEKAENNKSNKSNKSKKPSSSDSSDESDEDIIKDTEK